MTTRIGLRLVATNFAPFYALRRCPSLGIHCYSLKVLFFNYLLLVNHTLKLFFNDPAAGSPTAALLRLLLPPDIGVRRTSPRPDGCRSEQLTKTSKSVGATGGVYKRQGRSRRAIMKRTYKTFLVHGGQFQPPIPTTTAVRTYSQASEPSYGLAPSL